jgi:hypothetical protein
METIKSLDDLLAVLNYALEIESQEFFEELVEINSYSWEELKAGIKIISPRQYGHVFAYACAACGIKLVKYTQTDGVDLSGFSEGWIFEETWALWVCKYYLKEEMCQNYKDYALENNFSTQKLEGNHIFIHALKALGQKGDGWNL